MLKKLVVITLLLLLLYVVFVDSITSRIIFSNRSFSVKLMELAKYFLRSLLRLIWRILRAIFFLLLDLWHRMTEYSSPSYNIHDFEELYQLYQRVSAWSDLPWQVFWGIHAEETNLGRNLGSTTVLSVLPGDQKSFFYQICRELKWDPEKIQGSHKGAIGPFQFIPETWVRNAIDANQDGRKDPFDVEDAAYSAANYLLSRGALTDLRKALWHYNQDYRYVNRVMRYLDYQ
ncbi:hypothetical protein U27_00850 [Candidatus Vecturithrix granuli]|uniref:Transglycosylase SLT domain-containing protein n=1 Tax=Vecturithrix granuli TaxID=1499967 RepID=A0A081C8P7_VECG1|nr:hypothetical protein U27_00850 [Candidatus Vecturithrix granuli]